MNIEVTKSELELIIDALFHIAGHSDIPTSLNKKATKLYKKLIQEDIKS